MDRIRLGCFVLATIAAAYFLHLRVEEPQKSAPEVEKDKTEEEKGEIEETHNEALTAFTPVDLSFHDLCYEVNASKGSEKLRLLKSVSGIFRSGRMCALMGESGAGKVCIPLVLCIVIVLL